MIATILFFLFIMFVVGFAFGYTYHAIKIGNQEIERDWD